MSVNKIPTASKRRIDRRLASKKRKIVAGNLMLTPSLGKWEVVWSQHCKEREIALRLVSRHENPLLTGVSSVKTRKVATNLNRGKDSRVRKIFLSRVTSIFGVA